MKAKTVKAVKPITKEDAVEALNKERLDRAKKCEAAISELLQQHDCAIVPITIIRSGMAPVTQFNIEAK